MDANWVRKPHLYGNTVEFHRRNGNQRRLHHCKLYGCKSVTYTDRNTDGYRNSYCYSDSYTNCNSDSYGYTNCNSDTHTDAYPGIEWINLQWWAVC